MVSASVALLALFFFIFAGTAGKARGRKRAAAIPACPAIFMVHKPAAAFDRLAAG